jgi:hypothetical protein
LYIKDYFHRIDQVISGCPARKYIPSHHKHVSDEENVVPASIPDLEDVLKEVIIYLP